MISSWPTYSKSVSSLHDLRRTGGTLSEVTTGATLKDLMARLGHSSVRASLIYEHASRDRDQAIAKALGTLSARCSPKAKRARLGNWNVASVMHPGGGTCVARNGQQMPANDSRETKESL